MAIRLYALWSQDLRVLIATLCIGLVVPIIDFVQIPPFAYHSVTHTALQYIYLHRDIIALPSPLVGCGESLSTFEINTSAMSVFSVNFKIICSDISIVIGSRKFCKVQFTITMLLSVFQQLPRSFRYTPPWTPPLFWSSLGSRLQALRSYFPPQEWNFARAWFSFSSETVCC